MQIAIDLDSVFQATGTSANIATIDAVLANPELFFFCVHNAEFPGGAVQGSLG